MSTPAERIAATARAAFVAAGLAYAESTEETGLSSSRIASPQCEPALLAVRMRLAAKAMLGAERAASESRRPHAAPRAPSAGVQPIDLADAPADGSA